MDSVGIKIGNDIESIKTIKQTILDILNAKADQETIRVALNCLKESSSISHVHLEHVNVTMDSPFSNKPYKSK